MSNVDDAYEEILKAAASLAKRGAAAQNLAGSQMVLNAAHAYRAVLGGAQPGGIYVDNK